MKQFFNLKQVVAFYYGSFNVYICSDFIEHMLGKRPNMVSIGVATNVRPHERGWARIKYCEDSESAFIKGGDFRLLPKQADFLANNPQVWIKVTEI